MIDEKKLVEFIKSDDFIKTIIRGNESLKDILIQLIEEQPKLENTAGFKHFKMYSDSTLKNTSKNYLIDYLHMIYANWKNCDGQLDNVIKENYRISNQLVEWISVKDRLPDNEGMYLITSRVLDRAEVQYAFYQKNIRMFICNGKAIAWMSLPEPYRVDIELV